MRFPLRLPLQLPRIPFSTLLFSAIRIYILLVVLVYFFQDKLIFFPRDHDFKDCPLAKSAGFEPVESNLQHTTIRFFRRRPPNAKAWVILFHGNGGTACASLGLAENLLSVPVAIALVEYPGYENDGDTASEASLLENGLTTYDLIATEEEPLLPMILYGESLGTGVATYVASKRDAKGLILQSPYTSTLEVGQAHYPYLPIRMLMRNRFPAYKWAPKVEAPVLILHGTDDRVIPFRFGEAQARNFKKPPRFVKLEGVGHDDIFEKEPGRAWGEITAFIQELIRPQRNY